MRKTSQREQIQVRGLLLMWRYAGRGTHILPGHAIYLLSVYDQPDGTRIQLWRCLN
jgi:hypothetical protein